MKHKKIAIKHEKKTKLEICLSRKLFLHNESGEMKREREEFKKVTHSLVFFFFDLGTKAVRVFLLPGV